MFQISNKIYKSIISEAIAGARVADGTFCP